MLASSYVPGRILGIGEGVVNKEAKNCPQAAHRHHLFIYFPNIQHNS